jgi:hypothetical protein
LRLRAEQYAEEPLRLQQRAGPRPTRPNGSSSTCCLQGESYWLFSRKPGSGLQCRPPPDGLMQPGMEAPAGALARRGSHVRLADASGLQLGPIGLSAGNAPHSVFANRGEPEQTPKRVGPAGERAKLSSESGRIVHKTVKKVHRIRGAPQSGIATPREGQSMVTVLYSTERTGGRGSRERFSLGPIAAGSAFIAVRHARPAISRFVACALRASRAMPTMVPSEGQYPLADGHTKKK